MTTSPDEASIKENRNPVEPGELPVSVRMRMKAKADIISRLREVETQVLALTPGKLFYGSTLTQDIAAEVKKAREAVGRL